MADKILSIGLGINTSKLPSDINEATRIVSDGAAKIGNATGAASEGFKSLSQAVRQSTKDAEVIATYLGTTSEAFKNAALRASNYKQQLSEVNTAIQGSASVAQSAQMPSIQKAASGYNGLSMSINQLTREMPAFTYSMQTGFMAISNNIPMLVDQLNILKAKNLELAASGLETQSTLKAVAGALFSWQSAISIGVTLLTVFGGKLINYIADQYDTAKATAAAAEAQKKQNENLETYSRILNGLTKTVKERNNELKLELAAKQMGISVDEMKVINLEKTVDEKQKLLDEKIRLLNNIDKNEATGKGKAYASQIETEITQIQKQIAALTDLQSALSESAYLKGKSNELKETQKINDELLKEQERYQAELAKMKLEMDKKSYGKVGDSYLIGEKKQSRIYGGVSSNSDMLQQGIANAKKLQESVSKEPILISFKTQGLDEVQKAGIRIAAFKEKLSEMGNVMAQLAERTFVNFATSLGRALGGEKMDLGSGIKTAIAELCSMLAGAAAALGTFYFSIGDVPQGIAAYAASAALGIAAGVLSAGAGSSTPSGVSSSASTTNAGTFGNGGGINNNFGVLQVGGQIRGNNLLVSVQRSGYERGRVR